MKVAYVLRLMGQVGRGSWCLFLALVSMPGVIASPSPQEEMAGAAIFNPAKVYYSVESPVDLALGNQTGDNPKDLPKVTVATLNNSAYAETRSAAVVEITRTGKEGDLAVNLLFDGTAVNGAHYEAVPGAVVIPDGSKSIRLEIRPIPNDLGEGDKVALIKLAPSLHYQLGNRIEATVWIYDVAYQVWRVQHFGSAVTDSTRAERLSDPDGDGYCNYVEFLFDLDPLYPDHIRPEDLSIQKDKATFRTSLWCRYSGLEEFKAEIEYSTSLIGGQWIKPENPAERCFAVATPLGIAGYRKRQLVNAFNLKEEMGGALFLRIVFQVSQ